jgi:hypothetical protein
MVRVARVVPNELQDHHGSHRDLLWSGEQVQLKSIDAVIVPTARRPAYLREAAALAEALGCTLVTLHSKQWTSADKALVRLPRSVDVIAIDVPDPADLNVPHWRTSQYLPDKIFPRLANFRRTDLSAKRNLGLVLSRLLGWSAVMFVDDDITELDPRDVRTASGMLDVHNAVGLHVCGFHDHSVVCHAFREAGGGQQSFIGGGALVVQAERTRSFFPEIYNDDWFFLLDGDKGLQPSAVTGRVVQYPYDPFRPDRARAEEFGDVLAEGIFWLLDQQLSIADADEAHWTSYLEVRKQFIERVVGMVEAADGLDPTDKARRIDALQGSLGRLRLITPQLCMSYLRAWQADRESWRLHIESLPTGLQPADALALLTRPDVPRLHYRLRSASSRGPSGQHAPDVRRFRRDSASAADMRPSQQMRPSDPVPATAERSCALRVAP